MRCANYGREEHAAIGADNNTRNRPEATTPLTGRMSRIHVGTLRTTTAS